jgi:hypothetical protein
LLREGTDFGAIVTEFLGTYHRTDSIYRTSPLLVLIHSAELNTRVYNTVVMKTKARREKKGQPTFDIFTTSPSGSAQHIESVESLAAARQHLKQLVRRATGDCFIYSKENGIVELIVYSDAQKPRPTTRSSHIIQGRLAS